MKRLSKRIISSVLTGTMLLSLLGGSALAVEPEGGPEEEVRSGQPVMSDVVSIQAYTEETETGNELKQIEIVYKEGTDFSGLNGESYLLEGRGPQDEEFTEIQIQEVTVDEESALLVVGGFTTNHDISEGTEEGMDLRLRHTWEEEDSALSMSRGEPSSSQVWRRRRSIPSSVPYLGGRGFRPVDEQGGTLAGDEKGAAGL